MAKAKKTGKALVVWEKEFAELAKAGTAGIKSTEGTFISFRGGKMSVAGADVPDDELRGVIVGWAFHNTYYDPSEPYDPENPAVPGCYAYGEDEDEMVPHDAATDKQADACAGCPMNEFGSAMKGKKQGKGKACKNTIKLAIIAEQDIDNAAKAQVYFASIPPTSRKNILTYLTKSLRDGVKRPPWAVITKIARVPDDKDQFRVTFELGDLIEDTSAFPALKALADKVRGELPTEYKAREQEAPARKAAKKPQKFAGKFGAKK